MKEYVIEHWLRLLDDCQILLDTLKIKPTDLLIVLNSINKFIQFTLEFSDVQSPFLDILVNRGNKIWMDLYRKPTDPERYVPFTSNHPFHCKINIPFTLARRICMIVENVEKRKLHLERLKENLSQQHYPEKIIENGIAKAEIIPQSDLRKSKPTKTLENNQIPFVTTYNPNNPAIFNTIKSTFENLQRSGVPGFKDSILLHSRRQAPNLKRILTKAAFSEKTPTADMCKKPRCECCKHILISDHYTFKSGYRFELKRTMTCDSADVIYVLICQGCMEEYIGETGEGNTKIRDLCRVYRQHIKDKQYQMLKVEEHVRNCGKGNFKIFPFLQLNSRDTSLRKALEDKFIKKFKPKLN